MLTRENNELICRVSPDTPMGKALRRYWLPVLQTSDLPSPDCDPFPLVILGDRFVAFRLQAIGRSIQAVAVRTLIPKRRADLSPISSQSVLTENGKMCISHVQAF
jgi:hypothetical protein